MIKSRVIRNTNKVPELKKAVRDATRRIVKESAEEILDIAQQLAPVLTGELRDSGKVDDSDPDEVLVVFDADHAVYVEYGTSKQDAQPFLRPAVGFTQRRMDERLQEIADEVEDELE